jgi:putative phosphoribosyl transferase
VRFRDRKEAGRLLAERLETLRGQDVVVLGLPRGGVPVGAEVAHALGVPLDVIVVRKVGVPFQHELAMGAVGEGGVLVVNERVVRLAHVGPEELERAERRERAELESRVQRFRGDRPAVPLDGRTAVIVDDGIATGSTARAACAVARALGAARIVLAAPVCARESARVLASDADEVVCLETPRDFGAVGQFYVDFRPTEDGEVADLLERAVRPSADAGNPLPRDEEIRLTAGSVRLAGHLTVPAHAYGLVIFAHGSGSSRHSPRNRSVAKVLQEAGLATLLFDLLTPQEEVRRTAVFDIEVLASRLAEVTAWVRTQPGCASLPIGWFGASTGAGAALRAAAEPDADVAAVVSRGGRPDLAGPHLAHVRAPTLLIVGGDDDVVLGLNEQARSRLRGESRLAVVPGATHLFEEPGTLAAAAALARDWFVDHLARVPQAVDPPSVQAAE